jgi:hypothetical protein
MPNDISRQNVTQWQGREPTSFKIMLSLSVKLTKKEIVSVRLLNIDYSVHKKKWLKLKTPTIVFYIRPPTWLLHLKIEHHLIGNVTL